MKYYRVKPQHDNKIRYTWNNRHKSVRDGIIIGDELYTQREFEKLAMEHDLFEVVEVSKRDIYFFFGARFENEREV